MYLEILGYIGSVIIICSILTTSMLKYRFMDSIGCIIFIIYGVAKSAYPLVLISIVMFIIHQFAFVIARKKQKRK